MWLIYLRSEDNTKLVDWMKQRTDKYTSADIQNEMVKVMALRVLRKIAGSLQSASFFTVMVDETTDVSNVEQVVICIRWVSEKFEVQEEFVGLYKVPSTGAEIIYAAITDVLLRLNLAISKVRGQCYDGAATMSGAKSGVATRLYAAEPRAIFTHCYGHSLNLACGDTIKRCKLMQDALDTTHEITKLIKKSPARDAIFKRLKEEMGSDSPGFRVLCPTRWTVRAEALKSILDNFNVLLELWAESLERVKDTEMKARIQGVSAQMMRFDYFFGVSLGLLILRHTDNLSKTMQKADISVAELLLPTHLEIFSKTFRADEGKVMVSDILAFFRNCTPGQLELMSQVSKLVKLLLVMPATNAGSERSFSAVRRIKTYLRSTMYNNYYYLNSR